MPRSAPKPSPAWHEECRDLRRRGRSIDQLAAHFGKHKATIHWVLDEHGERQAQRERVNGRRAEQRGEAQRAERRATLQLVPVEAHNAALHRDLVMAAARAFAAGEIDRATLMARIGGGER